MEGLIEFVSLSILLVSFFLMLNLSKRIENWKYILIAFFFSLLTGMFTVFEGYLYSNLFNFFEHLFWLVSGGAFVYAGYIMNKEGGLKWV